MKEIRAAAAQAHVASPDRVNVVRTTRSSSAGKGPDVQTVDSQRRHHRGDEGRPGKGRRDGLPRYASVQALFDGLHADD